MSGPGGVMGWFARRRIFYGWVVVAATFVLQMVTAVSITGLSTYVVPLEHEFGWSRASIGFGRSFQQLDAAMGPFTGSLADRIGPRRMFLLGAGLYGVALALFSRIDSVWTYYAASALMAVANAFCGLLVVSIALNHWFRRKRTTALGLSVLGYAVAGVTVVPLLVLAQSTLGWREAAFLSAVFVLLIGMPAAFLTRDAPERHGLLPDGEAHGPETSAAAAARALADFSLGEAIRTRAFWLMTLAAGLALMTQYAVLVYQFAHIEGLLSRGEAAASLASLNLFSVVGRVLGGYLGDRLPKHTLLGLDLAGTVVSLVILVLADSLAGFIVYGALFGLFWGIRTPIVTSMQAEYFGRRSYGRIAGTMQTLMLPLTLAAPVLAGLVADAQHDYRPAFAGTAVAAGLSSALFFTARRPRKAVRAG